MKTVSLSSSRTTGARKKSKGKKKKKNNGQKKPPVGGVSRADLERFGIVPVGGKKKSSGKKKTSGGKKSRGKKKSSKTTGSRDNRALTKQVKKQLNKLGISVNGKTTGMMAPRRREGFVGNVMGAFGDLWGYGSGAVMANALGGSISQFTGRIPGLGDDGDTRLPWNKLLVSVIGAFLVSMPAFRRWAERRGGDSYWSKARRGMLGAFGFAAVYNLVRAGADMADMNLDNPQTMPEDLLSYVGGTNGLLSEQAGGNGANNTGGRVVGGVTDLFGQEELVQRLAGALDELQTKRDELTVALDGLYGDISDEQLAVYTAASDYVAAVDNRIRLAQEETDLDVATEIVLDGMNMATIAQGMLAGLTAGVTAQAQQFQQQQLAPEQQAVQQLQQQAQEQAAQAAQLQQAAQQQAAQAQQLQQMGQVTQAQAAQQQAQELQQAAIGAQAQAQQAIQTAQAYQQQMPQQMPQQQAYQQQAFAQQGGAPMQPPAYGAPTAGGYYPFESGPAGAGAVGGVMSMPDGSSLHLNQTFTASGRDGGSWEVDGPSARQLLTTVGTTSGIDANRLAQWANHLSTVSGGNLAGRDLMKAWLQSNAGAIAGTNPGGQVGSRIYGNTTGARATSTDTIPLAVHGRVVMCPTNGAGMTRTVDGIMAETGMA